MIDGKLNPQEKKTDLSLFEKKEKELECEKQKRKCLFYKEQRDIKREEA